LKISQESENEEDENSEFLNEITNKNDVSTNTQIISRMLNVAYLFTLYRNDYRSDFY